MDLGKFFKTTIFRKAKVGDLLNWGSDKLIYSVETKRKKVNKLKRLVEVIYTTSWTLNVLLQIFPIPENIQNCLQVVMAFWIESDNEKPELIYFTNNSLSISLALMLIFLDAICANTVEFKNEINEKCQKDFSWIKLVNKLNLVIVSYLSNF